MYYVWGPCQDVCPEGSYAGVELWIVGDSSELRDYMMLVNQRDAARTMRNEGFLLGLGIGGIDAYGAFVLFTPACIGASGFTLGTSCIVYITGVLSAGGVAAMEISRFIRGMREFDRLTDALPGDFFDIPHQAP